MACGGGCKGCSVSALVQSWLAHVESLPPSGPILAEVRFKGWRRELFWLEAAWRLPIGSRVVVVELIRRGKSQILIGNGYDIGRLTLVGKAAQKLQTEEIPPNQRILRAATDEEVQRLQQLREKEMTLLPAFRALMVEEGLQEKHQMQIVDLEYQADESRVIIYFTAEDRVDFRSYMKRIQEVFKVRPEMYQISERQASAQVGGVGACGRELCCSSFLRSFHPVTTEMARYQGLAINMNRLAGFCGKLKCCLAYELDAYKAALDKIPKQIKLLRTAEGEWRFLRTEILLERLWFAHTETGKQVCLLSSEARRLADLNQAGEVPPSIEPFIVKFPDLAMRV